MNSGINLLTTKKRESRLAPYLNKLKLIRILALFLLFGVSAAAIIIFLLIAASPLPELKRQQSSSIASISQYHQQMSQLAYINERLTTASTILNKRTPFDNRINSLKQKVPAGMVISNLTMSKTTISITAQANSLGIIDTFMQNLIRAVEEDKEYAEVTLNNLATESQLGSYTVNITIVL